VALQKTYEFYASILKYNLQLRSMSLPQRSEKPYYKKITFGKLINCNLNNKYFINYMLDDKIIK
jgi:hypothetical protein